MPKMKTKSSAKKRLKLTAKGRIKRGKARRSHILTKMSKKRKRKLRKGGLVSSAQEKKMKMMLSS